MGWYRDLKAVLAGEPETWLCYLYGQQTSNLPLLTEKKPRYRGFLLQVAKFGATLLRDFRFKKQVELNRPTKFFIFAGTANQMRSLDQTIDALVRKREHVVAVGNPRLLTAKDYANGYVPFQLTLFDILRVLVLFSTRGWRLYRAIKAKHPVSVDWHFSTFCGVYIYLVYFYRVLSGTNPEFVITANDHNAPNRCMLAVAHHFGIKTVYLQHASVSNIFPALRVNYAFLDGQYALETYRECEPNQPYTFRNVPVPKVILSGQKKHLQRVENSSSNAVGVALNALDDSKVAIDFIKALAAESVNVRLRWHPGQAPRDTQAYRDAFAKNERVTLSDPKQQSISEFMEKVDWLIAGNSSIHLEAALAGVMPIYYELSATDLPDYYGYVKNDLTQPVDTVEDVLELLKRNQDSHVPNEEAVRYYSSTYLTEWEGQEGELVAESLIRLSAGVKLPVESVRF